MANTFNGHFGVGSKRRHDALKLFVYLYGMKKVAILVPETAIVAAIADPRYMLSAVNQFLSSRGERPLFDIQLVGMRVTVPLNNGLFSIHPDLLLDSAEKFDLIFIPALSGDMKTAQEYIEQQFQDKILVEQLADLVAVGRRSFERRFKKATNNTVVAYIQRVKMEAAKRSLENTRKQVNDVMFEVGYTDSKAFREVFKKVTGITPLEYRNKFNRVVV